MRLDLLPQCGKGYYCVKPTNLFLKMKLLTIFIFLALTQVWATGYSQKITLNKQNVSVETVLKAVQEQTEYRFLYDKLELPTQKRITFTIRNGSIEETLDRLFEGLPLTYKIFNKNIVIRKETPVKREPSAVAPAKPPVEKEEVTVRQITGKVTDDKKSGLPGVSIRIKGTQSGMITDVNGNFSLDVPDENAILVFSFVGYENQEIVVGNRTNLEVILKPDEKALDELVVIGYGVQRKGDLTGSVVRVKGEDFKTQSMVQVTEMLSGTVAGLNTNQATTAAGGASMEVRGPKSLSAGTEPLIVLDGAVFRGSLREINPSDIQTIDILKDASSAAVYGSSAASGVILITTVRGKVGKPTVNFATKVGMSQSNNQRRGLGPEAYLQFREDHLRQISPNLDVSFFTNPDKLPEGTTIEKWRSLSPNPQADNTQEWMSRLRLFPEERENYLDGKTMDMYDEVFRNGLRQDYDLSINGGTDRLSYYWSVGYNNNQGILVGDQYSSVSSRLNVDFTVVDWLKVGVSSQFSDRDESSVPASLQFYVNSPYGQMFDAKGNLKRLPHGHSDNPLLEYYRTDLLNKTNSLFSNMYAELLLPFGITFKTSFQPKYANTKYYAFKKISEKLGGFPNETASGERRESSSLNWMIDNVLTWKREMGIHTVDVTLLANAEKNQFWSTVQSNQNFNPNQELGYHGLQFGSNAAIVNNDTKSTGDALMARVNYSLMGKYLLTASVRRDGFSAFGNRYPRATFPAVAAAWIISNENFFKSAVVDRLKMRLSWGVNGNRNIGIYSAQATVNSTLWYDGSSTRVGVFNSTLANSGLRWERTTSLNGGIDISLLKNRIDLTVDAYDIRTTDLLMNRILPQVTGFTSLTANLGELGNRGMELNLNTVNVRTSELSWSSNFVFSFNRNKVKKLFGDMGKYTLLGEQRNGEVPDFSNQWFPGQPLDVIWDYDVVGIWQTDGSQEAAKYNMQPGDYKAVDVNNDGKYVDLQDKRFIGYDAPRYRLGLRNDFRFLKNFTASVFVRADLGHLGAYSPALNGGWDQNDRFNRNVGPVPYWTADRPNNEYPRLNTYLAAFGGGIMIYKPRSFVRVQDVSLAYDIPREVLKKLKMNSAQVFGSVRNLATFSKWPGWDPESGMNPMPRNYTLGLSLSL